MKDLDRQTGFSFVYPLTRAEIVALPLADSEHELRMAILAEPVQIPDADESPAVRRTRHPRRRWGYAGGVGLAAVALAALILLVGPGAGTEKTVPAFATSLVRVAKTSPLVLLEEPGWHVGSGTEVAENRGEMHFFHRGGPAAAGRRESAELRWRSGRAGARLLKRFERHARYRVFLLPPVLDTRVLQIQATGPPGRERFAAVWEDRGRVLVFRSTASDLTAFERRLGALRRVGPMTWLTALPEELTGA
jgi:hypothetical protein